MNLEGRYSLNLCTATIAESPTATHLIQQKERLESAIADKDIPLALDASKALLESIFKTVLTDRLDEPDLTQDFMPLYKTVRDLVSFNDDQKANDIFQRMGSQLVHNVGELRNSFGAASHGDDGYYVNPIGFPELQMIASMVDGLGSCIYSKHKATLHPALSSRIHYLDHPEFNDWLDEQFPGWDATLSNTNIIHLTASQLIYSQDENQYREMLLQYLSTEEEDAEDGDSE